MPAAHTPDEAAAALTAVEHVAKAEAHAPREAGIAGVGSSRPVDGGLDVAERVASGQRRARKRYRRVNQAGQLLDGGEPPSFAIPHIPSGV